MKNRRRIFMLIFLVLFILTIGVIGYMVLLDISFIDALYMTVITISTVGYGEVGVATDASRLFSIFIIFSGLSVVGYGITGIVSLLFEGEIKVAWRQKRMELKIKELKNHYIVCGAGDVGRTVIKSLKENSHTFIVIEEDERRSEELKESGILTILGDATLEETLDKAGIHKARGIVCTLPNDAENVFTVLTARQMNSDVYIVSKAVEPSAHNKLKKAGANNTISPYEIGGQRMAALLIRPSLISFLDLITRAGDAVLDLEEVEIPHNSSYIGKKLYEAKIPEQTGLIILALKRKGENDFKFNPSSQEMFNEGDTMVVLGTKEQVARLNIIVRS